MISTASTTDPTVMTPDALDQWVRRHLFSSERESDGVERVGLEVELFPVIVARLGTPAAQARNEAVGSFPGLYAWLHRLAEGAGWKQCSEGEAEKVALRFELPSGGLLTLEPAGQIEYSGAPHDSVESAVCDAERFERMLADAGRDVGVGLIHRGFNAHSGDGLPELVVRKPRYIAMDRHFAAIGPWGQQMMRSTCSTQVNLDFGPRELRRLRWNVANGIAPALNALFANSPVISNGQLVRSWRNRIWLGADPSRAGRAVFSPDEDPATVYTRFALDATVMLVRDFSGAPTLPSHRMSFGDWLCGSREHGYPDLDDWRIHLSTLFPHVRPRGFMEIRTIDALPAPERRAAVLLTASLLTERPLLDAAAKVLDTTDWNLSGDDWAACFDAGRQLLEAAIDHLPADRAESLVKYHRTYTAKGLTPADRH